MSATTDTETRGIDRVDAVALAAAVGLGLLALAWSVLTQRILLGLLAVPFLAATAVAVVVVRRADRPAVELDRVDAAAAGVAGVFGLLALAYGVLTQRILLLFLVAAVVGLATGLALAVRRIV